MFSKEAQDLYRSIHAPDSLKEKIRQRMETPAQKPKQKHYWKPALTAAACLALVILAALNSLHSPAVELTLNGTLVENSPVAVTESAPMAARAMPAAAGIMEIALELTKEESVTVSVSYGEVQRTSPTSLVWSIPADVLPDSGADLTLAVNEKEIIYSLFCDDAGSWYLVKAKQ